MSATVDTTRAVVLQLCPFAAWLEEQLARRRCELLRWFELDPAAQQDWLRARAPAVRAVVTAGNMGCSSELLQALPALGLIAVNGVGVDKVDLPLARARGVRVTTTPGTLDEDVADLAVGLIIALVRNIPAADAFVRAGSWLGADLPLAHKVSGRRFGIVGLGQIGSALATRLAAFGPVAYTGPRRKAVPFAFHASAEQLARHSDVLVVACPANAATRHLIGPAVLAALGPAGYLVNVARGAVVDETALVAALADGRIAGAALDVFEDEPRVPAGLRSSPRVVLTPHVGSATVETRQRMAELVLANLDAFLAGEPLPSAID
ncbi:MAG: 2-hydroxyacid dehydrogenase [Gammaproteobacteria bacterium]|nr:2-hydroxyacid dehydrogenase [Gammaproteobacteria bacterium]